MRIDSHHHFWNYDPAAYGWIDDAMRRIRRDFLPDDLRETIRAAGIDRVISVQARQSDEETDWLLDLADAHGFIHGVVGWVDLRAPGIADRLAACRARSPKFKAARHVLQDEPDNDLMDDDAFNRGIDALAGHGLVYDILIFERHLRQALRFVDRHPEQSFVVDHAAKPRIARGETEPWAAHMRELALRPNVSCKLSGMTTEADWNAWTPAELAPYIDTVLDAFGPSRCLFGSDWPVCLVACEYDRWVRVVETAVGRLSADEQSAIWGGNAMRIYG